ncbi:MAG: ABC transporter permease [Pseudomonadota bacterium]
MIRVAFSLAQREFIRFIRQPQRVIGAVAQPLLFWLFLGAGLGGSFRPPGMEGVTYLEYFYPGVMVMMMLFASIFSSITIIEDRDAGFLQGVLVAPVNRMAIVLGKVTGGVAIAMVQVVLFTAAAPFLGLSLSLGSLLMLLVGFVLTGLGFAALGFLLAWPMKSTSGFHAIMMVFLMPLWLLSGALFPVTGVPGWLYAVMMANPVHHALNVIRAPFYGPPAGMFADGQYLTSLAVTVVWAAACLVISMMRVGKREKGAAIAA